MCTAILHKNDNYCLLSRTLDLECSYGEKIVITPRGYSFPYRYQAVERPLALIGTAHLALGVPLYYDAMNECGLMGAALNFPDNARYRECESGRINLSSYELLPYVLSSCRTLGEAREMLTKVNITADAFSEELKPSPLHWLFADFTGAIVVETDGTGHHVYENPFGVLTNNPPFSYHRTRIADFLSLDSFGKKNELCPAIPLKDYSRGMGAVGLPGDFSSVSRFVRSVFLENHTKKEKTPEGALLRATRIIENLSVPKGAVKSERGDDVYTVYTSCLSPTELTYYVHLYSDIGLRGVRLTEGKMTASEISSYSICGGFEVDYINT